MEKGHIRLDRQLLYWEFWNNDAMLKVWIALLLMANHEDKEWNGITIRRGQLVTSLGKLALLCSHKKDTIRSIIERLINARQITQSSTQRYTIITICNYDTYQGTTSSATHELTHEQTHVKRTNSHTKLPRNRPTNNNNTVLLSSTNVSDSNTVGVSGEFLKFLQWIDARAAEVAQMEQPFTEDQYHDLQQNFDSRDVADVLEAMSNTPNLIKRYKSSYKTCKSWLKRRAENKKSNGNIRSNSGKSEKVAQYGGYGEGTI